MIFSMKKAFWILLIYLTLFFTAGCGESELDSVWCDRKITVNGIDDGTEWKNARYFLDTESVTFGLLNDENTIYLLLSTRNQGIQRQITTGGFTVWFDENGGKKKNFGIRFPVGMKLTKNEMTETEQNPEKGKKPEGIAEPERLNEMLDAMQNEIEIIVPSEGKTSKVSKMSIAEAQTGGIICRIGNNQGNWVYELQIPIRRTESSTYGVTTAGSTTIGIGLETTQIEMNNLRRQPDRGTRGTGGMTGENRSGMMGRGSSYGGNSRQGGFERTMMTPPLEKWLKATLADKP